MKTAAQLKINETARIAEIQEGYCCQKLIEMGLLPGQQIKLSRIAPFGEPICLLVHGRELALRKKEAHHVLLQ